MSDYHGLGMEGHEATVQAWPSTEEAPHNLPPH